MSDSTSRILIVDDHPVFLDGMSALLGLEEGFDVCGKATGVAEAKTMVADLTPDVVIVDLTLDGDSGFDFILWLRDHDIRTPVLVASMHEDDVYVKRAVSSGAQSYVTKRSSSETIMKAIRETAAGRRFIDPALDNGSRSSVGGEATDPVKSLSPREFEVFERIGHGLGTAEIAKLLHRSVKTVESHRASIKRKLTISSAPELVRYATLWVQRH